MSESEFEANGESLDRLSDSESSGRMVKDALLLVAGGVDDDAEMEAATKVVADLLKLGVVRVRSNETRAPDVFLDVSIEGCRVRSFVQLGRGYIVMFEPGFQDWSVAIPYASAILVKRQGTEVQPNDEADGRCDWWLVKAMSPADAGVGPLRLTEAGARTLSVITGVPICEDGHLPEVDGEFFFRASAALQALADWCKQHPRLAKKSNLSAKDVLSGDFVI